MYKKSKTYKIIISYDQKNQRIDNFLKTKLKKIPKSLIYKLLRKGKIRLNTKRVQPKYKLKNKDNIYIPNQFNVSKKKLSYFYNLKFLNIINESILYEDKDILIINKPSGIAVHGGSGIKYGIIESLRFLKPQENFLELVHRLDRDTSGILLIAKNKNSLCALHKQLINKEIKKYYLALVHGRWSQKCKKISFPLLKIKKNKKRIVCINNLGKKSETYFQVKKRYKNLTLIKINPITGRTHQIRVHTMYNGNPIVCDDKYGNKQFDKELKKIGMNRLFLHAYILKFFHPKTRKLMKIKSPLDKYLKEILLKI